MASAETPEIYGYWDLLAKYLKMGGRELLIYQEEGSYQGEWCALMWDRNTGKIGVVPGDFGSCSACDMLDGASGPADMDEISQQLLAAVRTFDSWRHLETWLDDTNGDLVSVFGYYKDGLVAPLHDWALAAPSRQAIETFLVLRADMVEEDGPRALGGIAELLLSAVALEDK